MQRKDTTTLPETNYGIKNKIGCETKDLTIENSWCTKINREPCNQNNTYSQGN